MGIICERCGRDIDALGQDNMGMDAPMCVDCWNDQQSHAVATLRRKNRLLEEENARLRTALGVKEEKLRGKCADLNAVRKDPCGSLRARIECDYGTSRERALALTKLDECEMWLGRCEPEKTAAPTARGAAAAADAPALQPLMRTAAE